MNHPATRLGNVSQATTIEMSRAEAEVKAAVVLAQQNPRPVQAAVEEMRYACRQYVLADKAFFSYKKGDDTISKPSIHLARELALIWGNIQHGTMELSRDVELGQSEILAYAWDLQRNSRSSQVFISPHVRDTKTGPRKLAKLQDVYENNANAGARRLREAIFAVLPDWYVTEAVQLCEATLQQGDGTALADRVAEAVTAYERVGVTVQELETKVGRPRDAWDEADVSKLQILYQSVQRGELTRAEAFPAPHVTAEEVIGGGGS